MTTRHATAALLLLLVFTGQASSDQDVPLRAMLGDDVYQRCGLDRLDRDQVEMLMAHLPPPRALDYVEEAAVNFLQRDGWRVVHLQAAYREDPARSLSDIRHLAGLAPETLVIEAIGASTTAPLEPGAYLAKVVGFNLEVLDPRGEVRRYSIEERF